VAGETHDVTAAFDDLLQPNRMLPFAPLGSTDVPSAVVRRLRAAISLGLLPDGRRLPKEADLAARLGVTTFALREALAELRNQGLLVTRAGKYGGSFVTYTAESDQLEQDELVELSSAELRDVADWRQMLAAHAAALAAQRASDANIEMLAAFAARVGEAGNSVDARRAHGRFLLELASAAQSMRMARAEFAVHEQIDWLFGLALQTAEERAAGAAALTEIADAVRSRDAQQAKAAAERCIGRLLGILARLRFERIAARRDTQGAAVSTTLAGELNTIVECVASNLDGYARDVAPLLAPVGTFETARRGITRASLQRIEAFPPVVTGVGVVIEIGVMPRHPYWIQWWQRTEDGPVPHDHHVLDPGCEDFYDYALREFFDRPRRDHRLFASGPYVDYGCVDDFVLTISAPILAGDTFLGVTCIDILVADLESWLSPLLAAAGESYLINGERRVIVSNSATHGAGDLLATVDGFVVDEYPHLRWTLLTRPNGDG